MAFEQGVAAALGVRDDSLVPYADDLAKLPAELPLNVQGIPNQILSPGELAITQLDAVEIATRIRSRQFSCEEVVSAFLKRAALAQGLVNCITELLPEYAINRARYLDSVAQPLGPLHGVPISVKEQLGFEGKYNNDSFVAWGARKQGPPCSLNRNLEAAGAVIFARTTQPQSVMHLETHSHLYGRTVSPWNRNLTCGGSSGGEGALVSLGGSPLGVGGDIGGSIRSPAANCGVYGFKPSPFRIGNTGGMGLIVGQEGIIGCLGPISRSRAGLELFMQAYLERQPWAQESYLLPLPWKDLTLPTRPKIAVMWSDGLVKPHPPILRALRTVVDFLREADFTIVDWKAVNHDECWEVTNALYFEDGGKRLRDLLVEGEEPPLPLTEWLLEENDLRPRTVEEVWELKARRNAYRSMYHELWLSTGEEDGHPVDAILCPVGPGCAPPHDTAKYWNYTSQWNLLEYPAAVFPVTRVDPAVDFRDAAYEPMNAKDKFNYELYPGPEAYTDAPVSLQLVTRRFEDEKCLALLRKIEQAMGR